MTSTPHNPESVEIDAVSTIIPMQMYVALILKKEWLSCKEPIKCKIEGYDADFYYAYKVMVQE